MMTKKYKKICSVICILALIMLTYKLNKTSINEDLTKGVYDRPFKEHVVFYPQHQDDEVLWGGSAILNAIKQCGKDNVYIVLVSDGSGVNVFKNKKYKNLTRKEKENIRNTEFKSALKQLGVNEENIIILADIDNHEGSHFELMEKVALEFEDKLKSVTHIAQCYNLDNHPMHRKNGKVIHKLYKDGSIKDAMYFLKPKYAQKVDANQKVIYVSKDGESYNKVKKACMEYKIKDDKKHKYGVGYTSAHSYFDHLLKDPYLTSILYIENLD